MGGVSQSVQDGPADDRIRKYLQPIRQGPVAGQDNGGGSVAGVYQLVQQLALGLGDAAEGKIVDNDQILAG